MQVPRDRLRRPAADSGDDAGRAKACSGGLIGALPVTPKQIWLAVVITTGISLPGLRPADLPLSRGRAFVLAGLVGGLYSSTATVVVLAKKSQGAAPRAPTKSAAAILLAVSMMYRAAAGARGHLPSRRRRWSSGRRWRRCRSLAAATRCGCGGCGRRARRPRAPACPWTRPTGRGGARSAQQPAGAERRADLRGAVRGGLGGHEVRPRVVPGRRPPRDVVRRRLHRHHAVRRVAAAGRLRHRRAADRAGGRHRERQQQRPEAGLHLSPGHAADREPRRRRPARPGRPVAALRDGRAARAAG
ncbi:MAG: DUF4010 domain-containing protein [Marinilabiliales bacterium]|nr:DUF4010 domain-containing protein [Marinilabiliales bacterium]